MAAAAAVFFFMTLCCLQLVFSDLHFHEKEVFAFFKDTVEKKFIILIKNIKLIKLDCIDLQ